MGRQDVVSCFMAAARPTAQCHSQLHLLLRVHSHAWHASALPLAMSMQCQQHAPIALPGQRAGHREPRRGAHCEGRRQPWSSASGRDDRSRTAGRAARAACRPAGRATSGKPGQQIFMPPQIAMGTSASHQSPLWQDSGGVHSLACPLSLQAATACLPEGGTGKQHVSAGLLLVREEVQLLDLAEELEALRAQLDQVCRQARSPNAAAEAAKGIEGECGGWSKPLCSS